MRHAIVMKSILRSNIENLTNIKQISVDIATKFSWNMLKIFKDGLAASFCKFALIPQILRSPSERVNISRIRFFEQQILVWIYKTVNLNRPTEEMAKLLRQAWQL